ncbi:MAG TPA: biliverdin-producing heme oxygenase [Candidatus Obscuribacterales bacterium]
MQTTLHQHLKDSTRKRHEQAEGHPFQGALAQGKLPLASYRRYLVQLAHLHREFENQLRNAEGNPAVRSVVHDEHYQLPFLQDDLKALGTDMNSETALPVVVEFAQSRTFSDDPRTLLGVLYVLLGSKHGGKFIAHQVRETYGLQDAGYTYFDPFKDRFKPLWQDFTSALNALPDDEQLRNGVLQGADATFDVFVQIGDAIWRAQQASVAHN